MNHKMRFREVIDTKARPAAAVTATDTVLVEPCRGGCRVTWDADIRFVGLLRLLDPVFAWLFAGSVRSAVANLCRELTTLR